MKKAKYLFISKLLLAVMLLGFMFPSDIRAEEGNYSYAVIFNPIGLIFGFIGLNLEFQKVKIAGANPGVGAGFASWWGATAIGLDGYLRWFLEKNKKNEGLNVKAGATAWGVFWSGGNSIGFNLYGLGGYRFVPNPDGRLFVDLGIGAGLWSVRWGTWSRVGISPIVEGAIGIRF